MSPPLKINNVPAGTKFLAIIMDDPSPPFFTEDDAYIHWGVFNLPPSKTTIAEGENLAAINGVVLGYSSSGESGYAGMCPPAAHDKHNYKITVYALGSSYVAEVDNPDPQDPTPYYFRYSFKEKYKSSILEEATLTGTYDR